MSDELPAPKDLLDSLGALPADASLEAVRALLEGLREELTGASREYRALVREEVKKRLGDVEVVSAPASLADVYLQGGGSRPSEESIQGSGITLEEPEPWPEPVRGDEVLREIAEFYNRYLILPDGATVASTLWVMHSHAHDAAAISPILALTSPTFRCGKTTHLEVTGALVPKPLPAANVTSATIFRAVEAFSPTLLVDEADTFLHNGGELRGILNSGHRRSQAVVIRNVTVSDDYEVRKFDTWSPKAIALIGELPGTLADRSVEVRMKRKAPDEEVERLRRDQRGQFEETRRKAWRWAQDHLDVLQSADPEMPEELHDRAMDNWRPLFAIADLVGGPWSDLARQAALELSGDSERDQTEEIQLLVDIRRVFRRKDANQFPTRDLLRELNSMEERPWPEERGGKGLSANELANRLRPFEISPSPLWVGSGDAGRMLRGYKREDFRDAFRRYLESGSGSEVQEVQEQAALHLSPTPRESSEDGEDPHEAGGLSTLSSSCTPLSPTEDAEDPQFSAPLAGLAPSTGGSKRGRENGGGRGVIRPLSGSLKRRAPLRPRFRAEELVDLVRQASGNGKGSVQHLPPAATFVEGGSR